MSAYQNSDPSVDPYSTPTPYWLNKGDNAWQLTAATLVGIQSLPGLVILYGSYVKKKWAVNSTFMAMYAFAAVLLCWLLWAYNFSFGEQLLPFWGKGGPALTHKFLLKQSVIPATGIREGNLTGFHYLGTNATTMYFPMATTVYYQFVFAALTVILVAGSLLGRMNITAWMLFVPLWLTFSYTVGAFSVWGGGFLFQTGVLDYCGGYVIHLSSGIAGYTAAFWVDDYKLAREAAVHNASDFGPTYCLVKKHIPHPCESVRHPVGPRLQRDRERFPPNNLLLLLAGAGLLWLGWSGFNGGGSYSANIDASLAVINTHICAATSLLMWVLLDTFAFQKASVIGAVQGMITGLVCITPAAGFVEAWAAIIMGVLAGVIPWYSMNVLHKNSDLLKKVDDTMAVLHTHGVAGLLGGICVGLFAEPDLVNLISPMKGLRGLFYPWKKNGGFSQGAKQVGRQIIGALFIMGWNLVITSIVCLLIARVVPLRMSEAHLEEGDDAVHGEEAYALWGDGMTEEASRSHGWYGDAENGKSITDTPTSAPSTRPISLELSGMKAGQV